MATTDGSTTPPGTTPPGTTPPTSASITDLTNDLKDIQKNADVTLDYTTANAYCNAIRDFAGAIGDARTTMNQYVSLGNPGLFWSAQSTKNNLLNDITGANGTDGMQQMTDNYIAYLNEMVKVVKKSCAALLHDV
jgi:hypothetical protein